MKSDHDDSSAIMASPPSMTTIVEPSELLCSSVNSTEAKNTCHFLGRFPFESEYEVMPVPEAISFFLEWYTHGMNKKR